MTNTSMNNCHCNPHKLCIEEKHGVPLESYTCKKKLDAQTANNIDQSEEDILLKETNLWISEGMMCGDLGSTHGQLIQKLSALATRRQDRITELEESQCMVSASEKPPEKTGDYLCKMMDTRDECDDEWFEVVHYKVSQAFKSTWNTTNFDEVMEWMAIPGARI